MEARLNPWKTESEFVGKSFGSARVCDRGSRIPHRDDRLPGSAVRSRMLRTIGHDGVPADRKLWPDPRKILNRCAPHLFGLIVREYEPATEQLASPIFA